MNYDDETLMAYADGELEPAQRAEIAAAIERDPALAHRVEQHRTLRVRVSGTFDKVLELSMPERLTAAAHGAPAVDNVLPFPNRDAAAPGPRWRAREWIAMAASLVLGLFIAWRFFPGGDAGLIEPAGGVLVARGALATALDHQLASEQGREQAVTIGLTFRTGDGGYCRSFTLRDSRTAGLACRVKSRWRIPVTAAADFPGGDLQQAASAVPPAVLAEIESRIAGEPLDANGERDAQRANWQRAQ